MKYIFLQLFFLRGWLVFQAFKLGFHLKMIMNILELVHLAAKLVRQQEQAPGKGPFLLPGLPAHLAVGHIALFPFRVPAAGNQDAQLPTGTPRQGVGASLPLEEKEHSRLITNFGYY